MDSLEQEIRKAKRTNCIIFGIYAAVLVFVILAGWSYHARRSFSTEKWLRNPEERTRIVGDLLRDHELVGMEEAAVVELLGSDDRDRGYFVEEDRFVYYLGPERGFISIDSEWLILEFADGVVWDYDLTTD